MKRKDFTISQVILNVTIIILLFTLIYPLVMAVWCSFKSDQGFMYTKWYPTLPLRIGNYTTVLPKIWRYIVNTVFVAIVGTTGMLMISAASAYTFARLKFPGKEVIFMSFMALMMVPGVLTLIPNYMLYKTFGLLDSYWALILPSFIAPIGSVFLLRSFFRGIPEEVFESARMDGAKELTVFFKICLPLSVPILATLCIMSVNGTWNSYFWPLITIRKNELLTISAGLITRFQSEYGTNYPLSFSGYMFASIPLLLIFIFANQYYIEGITSAAIKL